MSRSIKLVSDQYGAEPPSGSGPATQEGQQPGPTAAEPVMRLGPWNAYFLIKFFLFWQGSIRFHPLENLAFAAFLLVPLHSKF